MRKELDILESNIENIYPSKEALLRKLQSDNKLKVYLGIDATSPEIHIGHAVALWKLRRFQDAGQKVILLVGDFTGMIGDPSDKTAVRKKLSREEVLENAHQFKSQASRILNFSGKNPAGLEFNSRWLSKLSLEDLIELAGNFTVQQLIERDMFRKRLTERRPIGLHEFLYPILQGYDSVALDVDVEIGGSDQTFNMLIGRQLLKTLKNKEKFVISLPLLPGTNGKKMSKSENNIIGTEESPNEMYGKVMSLRDELTTKYFKLCTLLSKDEVTKIEEELAENKKNTMEAKKRLAFEIVKLYHGEKVAFAAQNEFVNVFQKGARSSNVVVVEKPRSILPTSYAKVATISGGTKSISEAIRLAENKGLKIDGKSINNAREKLVEPAGDETIIDIGKRKSIKIIWS